MTRGLKHKVALIGSGNWGSVVGKIVGTNVKRHPQLFSEQVHQWVFEEDYKGERLSAVINRQHENPKYLPGVALPDNLVAEPSLVEACKDASLLVFVLPHQFVNGVCEQLRQEKELYATLSQCKAISLIKGLDIKPNKITLFSHEIADKLGIRNVAVLSGANIADEVAKEKFCETTIGCQDEETGDLFQKLFATDYFHVNAIPDAVGVELCGALKNIVAVAAGLSDGLDYGSNTKAALIRCGLLEMRRFGQTFFNGVQDQTFFESCGIADLITTCAGGRNRRVAEAFARTGKPIKTLERELLNGQKLQGTLTAKEVHDFLVDQNKTDAFPLFEAVYRIIYEEAPPTDIIKI